MSEIENGYLKLSKNVYRKELLPVGKFRKASDDLDFEITLDFLKHLSKTTSEMLADGITIPLVNGHKGESAYGQIIKMSTDDEKQTSYVDIEFSDDDCRKEALRNGVSAFIPPEFVDGKGRAWKRPLRHVASTAYPVIHGMSEWETISAAFNGPLGPESNSKRTNKMLVDDLCGALGLSFDADTEANVKEDKIVDDITKICESSLELSETVVQLREENATLRSESKKSEVNYPDELVSQIGDARKAKIDLLLSNENITPKVRNTLVKKYCNKDIVSISLSDNDSDDFNFVMSTLSDNIAVGKSGKKVLKLAHNSDEWGDGDSPLVAAAKAKAAV